MQKPSNRKKANWTILDVLKWTTSYFSSHGIKNPRMDAEVLLSFCLKVERIDLYLQHDRPLESSELASFRSIIRRRAAGEPVAYIKGEKEFWSMLFSVDPSVLIPRPETESVVEQAICQIDRISSEASAPLHIIDIGTGSGAIVAALAKERPGHIFFASDVKKEAVFIAEKNLRSNRLGKRVLFFAGDWMSAVSKSFSGFDLIVSNPPYIPADEIPALQPEISRYEPKDALDGGVDGLRSIDSIIKAAGCYLKEKGALVLEIGETQQKGVEAILNETDFYKEPEFFSDLSGKTRGVILLKRGDKKDL